MATEFDYAGAVQALVDTLADDGALADYGATVTADIEPPTAQQCPYVHVRLRRADGRPSSSSRRWRRSRKRAEARSRR